MYDEGGNILWEYEYPDMVYCVDMNCNRVVVGGTSKQLVVLDGPSGRLLYKPIEMKVRCDLLDITSNSALI